jgi:hypothetical protein
MPSPGDDVVTALRPFASEAQPLEAARLAGVALPIELRETAAGTRFPPGLAASLEREFGPAPPVTVDVVPRADAALAASGYAIAASTDLSVLNEILAELWRVDTIPNRLTAAETAALVTIAELRATCDGVPPSGAPGVLELSRPPTALASTASSTNLHLVVAFRLPVLAGGEETAALSGTLALEVPLGEFYVDTEGWVSPSLTSSAEATGILQVDPTSTITPSSETARAVLESHMMQGVRAALVQLFAVTLRFKAKIPIHKRRFPNSFLQVRQVGAATCREGSRDFVVVGINVQPPQHPVSPPALAGIPLPDTAQRLHVVAAESFGTDALASVVKSGDLAAFINRVIARHAPVEGSLPIVRVDGGRVAFLDGKLRVSIDTRLIDACAFGKDLALTARVDGTPAIANRTLTLSASEVDLDLDNTDAFLCAVLKGIAGPWAAAFTIAVLSLIAAYNPSASDLDIPIAETSDALPGSDKVVDVELTKATITPGLLTSRGQVRLITDTNHVYAYLRVVERMGRLLRFPVPGASVALYELDDPPPAGDDVVVPETGETEVVTPKYETTTVVQYDPNPDQQLGTQVTDESGRVTFVVKVNSTGGTQTTTRTQTETDRGKVVSHQSRQVPVTEAAPDLAVTITSPTGELLAQRRLVGLNVRAGRLGSFDHPVDVPVERTPLVGPGEAVVRP